MQLSDIEWGDVVADADGILEVEGRLGDEAVVVRRYRSAESRAVIDATRMLDERGERPENVLGFGDDWICFAAPDPFDDLID